jgi:hypothetical protein
MTFDYCYRPVCDRPAANRCSFSIITLLRPPVILCPDPPRPSTIHSTKCRTRHMVMVIVIPILHFPFKKQIKSLSCQGSGNSVPSIMSKQVTLDTGHRAKTRKALRENRCKSLDGGSFQEVRRGLGRIVGIDVVNKGKMLD